MRNVAIGLFILVLSSIVIQPLIEIVNIGREKIIVGTAITTSARVAKDRSLEYQFQRELDAVVNEKKFAEYFSEAFEKSLNLAWINPSDGTSLLKFKSNDGKYNDIIITLDFVKDEDLVTEQVVTKVSMEAESEYKFKTKAMKFAEEAGKDVDYTLVEERTLILSIKN